MKDIFLREVLILIFDASIILVRLFTEKTASEFGEGIKFTMSDDIASGQERSVWLDSDIEEDDDDVTSQFNMKYTPDVVAQDEGAGAEKVTGLSSLKISICI